MGQVLRTNIAPNASGVESVGTICTFYAIVYGGKEPMAVLGTEMW